MRVRRVQTRAAFAELSGEWRALSERATGAHLFSDPDWLGAWWAAFAAPGDAPWAYAAESGGRLRALLPLYRPARAPRRLESLFNHYLGRTDALVDPETPHALDRILDALAADAAGWDVAECAQAPEDGPLFCRLAKGPPAGLFVHGVRNIASPYLDLEGDFDGWYAGRFSSKKRQQDRRRRRQAEARGGRLDLLTEPGAVTEAFEAALPVEALGWKGDEGSAIQSRPETAAFMRDVVGRFAARGAVRLVTLRLEGRLAAFLLGFAYRGTLYFHKTGFDPAFERVSPGRLVLLESIRAAFQEGLARYDFLGAPDPYKLGCSGTVRPHATLFVYHRGLRSRLEREKKRTLVPFARRLGAGGPALPVRVDR